MVPTSLLALSQIHAKQSSIGSRSCTRVAAYTRMNGRGNQCRDLCLFSYFFRSDMNCDLGLPFTSALTILPGIQPSAQTAVNPSTQL